MTSTRFVVLLVVSCALATGASAQVINGEGTYEGSSLHDPPPPGDNAASRDRPASSNQPSARPQPVPAPAH